MVISKLPQQSKYEFLSRIKSLFTQKLIGVSFYSDNSSYLRILKYICWVFSVDLILWRRIKYFMSNSQVVNAPKWLRIVQITIGAAAIILSIFIIVSPKIGGITAISMVVYNSTNCWD